MTAEPDPTCRCGHRRSAHTDRCQACVADGLNILNNHEFIARDEAPEPATAAAFEQLRAESDAWRRKAIRRALGTSKLRGAIEGCRDLISEDITRSDAWGDGYREAISDLREILAAFGQLEPTPDGPTVAECAANDRRWPLEREGE
ncbi:hypothetical protein [Streptomyces sp. NPDC058254]|uniref:hypothetical protein n=1 Tax=Streptomyces sp. NPDC058254 TaxID=3346406 RepID=UPI0036EF06F6